MAVNSRRLTDEQIGEIWNAVRRQVAASDARESASGPRPPTVAQIYWVRIGTLIAKIAAVLASSYAYTITRLVWAWAASVTVLAGAGVLARRWKWLRLPAVSWLAGLGFTPAGALVLTLEAQGGRLR